MATGSTEYIVMENMKVSRVLETKGSEALFTIPPSATLSEFVRIACEKQIGSLLVADEDRKLLGIVTERDLMRQYNEKTDFDTTTVGDIATRNLIAVDPDDSIQDAMDLMIDKHIRHLPVLAGGEIRGLITVRDLIHAMREADHSEVESFVAYLRSQAKEKKS